MCSNSLGLLGGDGVTAYAPDMIGHGDSSKPSPSGAFDYSEEAYVRSIGQFADAVGMTEPFALIVQVGRGRGTGGLMVKGPSVHASR